MKDSKYPTSKEYELTTRKKILEEMGYEMSDLQEFFEHLPSGWMNRIRNMKNKDGSLKYTLADGETPVTNSYMSKVKTLRRKHFNMLADIMEIANEERNSKYKVNRISKIVKDGKS